MRTVRFACGALVVALCGATVGSIPAFVTTAATARADRTVMVHPGDDVNAAIARAGAGDTVAMTAGTYRGPIRVDRPIVLSGAQATVSAHGGAAAVSIVSDDVVVDSLVATCSDGGGTEHGIQVTGRHVRIVDSTVLQCSTGVVLAGASDAYLQGDSVIGGRSSRTPSTGVQATGADGLTMLGNAFAEDDIGVVVEDTSAPMLDSNVFSRIGTAISLRSVSDAVVDSPRITDASDAAILISGARGAEVARLDPTGDGGGSSASSEPSLAPAAGPGADGATSGTAIGSTLVTWGVSLLLIACAAGVLLAVRRSRRVR